MTNTEVQYRQIGQYGLSCGMMHDQRPAGYDEDGFECFKEVNWIELIASHERGKMYSCTKEFGTLEEGVAYMNALPDDFDAKTNPEFAFFRTSYGSHDWSNEDEFNMMDDEEKDRFMRGR